MSSIIVEKINEQFGTETIVNSGLEYDIFTLEIAYQSIHQVLALLKNDSVLNFHFLTDLCGVHFPDSKGKEIGVVYHLHNMYSNERVRVKTFFSIGKPEIPTATDLWKAANWMERETYDFFGIKFIGHPDLRRILNVDEMNYFPLRKEYPLEDATRTDKVDSYFGREGNMQQAFDERYSNKLN